MWEVVSNTRDFNGCAEQTTRLAVPGGWIYRTVRAGFITTQGDVIGVFSESSVFVPDPAPAYTEGTRE